MMISKEKPSLTAIVLAGGQSSRMGQDKALLTIGKQTLLSYVCNVAQESVNWVYIVTPWTEKYQNIVELPCCYLLRETLVSSAEKSNCPLIGFYQGLEKVKTEWVLLLACDLPRLNSTAIKKWCAYLTDLPQDAIALLPRHPKGWEPLCGFYRSNCRSSIKEYLDRGGRSFQHWLKDHQVIELELDNRSILFNCNTPEDWLNR
ncbi:MAG: molybdenum cofactor guanylyltransferase [Xenococcus sp. MO_188.B8]|nr:molybdenum cofactor guanylyltransferase [Xenococcus sp. MO_188.B8]